MAISETKMQIVIANYFKDECDVNTSIRQAFEKGFRIGVQKGVNINRLQGEWIDNGDYAICSNCGAHSGVQYDGVEPVPRETKFCPDCGAHMKGADDE